MPVRVERRDRVLTVIHSRPEARNAVDPEHAEALYQAFVAFDADDAADIAVFWGEGGAFCAGADLKRLATHDPTTPSLLEFPKDGGAVPRAPMGPSRLRLSKPVIAAIEGPAVAGGMELALWADCRVMADGAYMGIYNRRWGVPLSDGGTVRLPRLVGQGRALEIIMTGVDAEECLRIGLCEMVVPEGQARRAAEEMAHGIARFPQACVRADRRSVYLQHGRPSTPLWSESGPTAPGCSKRRGPLAPRDLPRARGGMAILAISGGRATDRLTQAITSNCRRHGPAIDGLPRRPTGSKCSVPIGKRIATKSPSCGPRSIASLPRRTCGTFSSSASQLLLLANRDRHRRFFPQRGATTGAMLHPSSR